MEVRITEGDTKTLTAFALTTLRLVLIICLLSFLPIQSQALESDDDIQKKSFALEARGFGTWGTIGDGQGYFPSVSVLTESGALILGWRFGKFTVNLYGEYFIVNQMTSTNSSPLNENANGSGYLIGPEIKWDIGKFSIAGSYLFYGQYQLSQQTSFSQTSLYDKPTGLSLTLGWSLAPRLSFIVTGKMVNYSEWKLNGSTVNVPGDNLSQTSYGVGLSYELF